MNDSFLFHHIKNTLIMYGFDENVANENASDIIRNVSEETIEKYYNPLNEQNIYELVENYAIKY